LTPTRYIDSFRLTPPAHHLHPPPHPPTLQQSRPLLINPRTTDSIKARDSRIGLIRRVFATLSLQLLLTALVTYGFFQNPGAVRFLLSPKGSWVMFASMAASLGSAIALAVRYSRVHPANLLLLALFTGGH
jgi:FtsH-binding integral membrane protein